MTLVADYVHIKIKRGELNDPANELVSEWLKYHMTELYNEMRMRIENATGWDKRDLNRNFGIRINQYGNSPSSYEITGYASNIGMTEIFMEFIARAGIALRRIKPFVTGSSIEFGNGVGRGLIRSPWVVSTYDHGLLLNAAQKELSVRLVGKGVCLANGKPGQHIFFDAGPIVEDTQLQDIWVMGEPNAVNDSVGMIRDQFRLYHHRTNDEILSVIRTKLSPKVVLLLKTAVTDKGEPQQLFMLSQSPIDTICKSHLEEYGDVCDEYLVGSDKFNCIHSPLVCPGALLTQLVEDNGNYISFRTDWVQAAIAKLNSVEVAYV